MSDIAIPRRRVFTRAQDNSILASEVRLTVRILLSAHRRRNRNTSLSVVFAEVRDIARREQTLRAFNPLSSAADAVDAAMASLGIATYDTISREEAILAYAAHRPAFLHVAGFYAQNAALACSALNRDDPDMRLHLGEKHSEAFMSPYDFGSQLVVGGAIKPINAAGDRLAAAMRRSVENCPAELLEAAE